MHMLYVNMLHICRLLHDFNVGQKRITYSTGLGDRLVFNSLARLDKRWPKCASGYGKSGGRGAKAPWKHFTLGLTMTRAAHGIERASERVYRVADM